MKLSPSLRAVVGAATACLIGAVPASAQMVDFSLSGAFSGPCSGTSCSFGGYTLGYSLTDGVNFADNAEDGTALPVNLDLGYFTLAHLSGASPAVAPTSLNFTMTITQTQPTGGTGTFSGAVTGTITTQNGKLYWQPTPGGFNIGAYAYLISTQNNPLAPGFLPNQPANNILIGEATGSTNTNTKFTEINGSLDCFNPNLVAFDASNCTAPPVTGSPEPATLVMFAPALLGLAGVVRYRRRSASNAS